MELRRRPGTIVVAASIVFAVGACAPEPSESGGTGGDTGSASGGSTGSGSGGASVGTGGAASGGRSGSGGAPADAGSPGTGGAGTGGRAGTGGAASGGAGGGASGGAPGTGGRGSGGGGGGGRGGSSGGAGGAGSGGRSTGGAGGPSDGGVTDGPTAYMPCPATGACAVMPLGDSITEGYNSSGGGYRVELFRQAVMNTKNVTFVGTLMNGPNMVGTQTFPKRHEGHDGYTIDTSTGHTGISGMLSDQSIATYRPNIILLMIGTNDINGNVDLANAPARLGRLIDELIADAPQALLVVATIIPIASDTINPRVQTYNNAIPAMVTTRAAAGKHVILVDNYAAFAQTANYRTAIMSDTLHPNDAGYALLGRTFYTAIGALLPPGP